MAEVSENQLQTFGWLFGFFFCFEILSFSVVAGLSFLCVVGQTVTSRWSQMLTWLEPASPFCPFLFCPERGDACQWLSLHFPSLVHWSATSVPDLYSTSSSDSFHSKAIYQVLPSPPNCSLPIFQTWWFDENCLMLVIFACTKLFYQDFGKVMFVHVLAGISYQWIICSGPFGHSECHDLNSDSIKQAGCSSVCVVGNFAAVQKWECIYEDWPDVKSILLCVALPFLQNSCLTYWIFLIMFVI